MKLRKVKRNKIVTAATVALIFCFFSSTASAFSVVSMQTVSQDELYKTIIEMKDDKIVFLNNVVNWIFVVVTIAVSILIALFGFLYNSIRKKYDELKEKINLVNKLADDLDNKNKEISNIQKDINNILSSQKYKDKILELENKLTEIDNKTKFIETEYLTGEKLVNGLKAALNKEEIQKLKSFLVEIIEYLVSNYKDKMDETNGAQLQKLKHESDNYIKNITEDEYDEAVKEKLTDLKTISLNLYSKYRNTGDTKYISDLLNETRKLD